MSLQGRGGWAGRVRAALGGGPCVVCRSWQRQAVCVACCERFADGAHARCMRCGEEGSAASLLERQPQGGSLPLLICGACRGRPPAFERTVVGVSYAYPWDALLTRFKFHQALELAPVLAEVLGDVVLHARILEPQGQPNLVLPVPLSEARLRQRGYNQAWELARRVARRGGLDACADGLRRVRDTRAQSELDRDERRINVRGAFAVNPHRCRVRGRVVAVVDDVMTTGATLDAAADALLRAGAAAVHVWVMARTPAPE